jgi:hypothetical protein
MLSTVAERARRWLDHGIDDPGLLWFRSAFGLVWLAYDFGDLLCSGTALCSFWPDGVFGAPRSLQLLQLGLIACEVAMIRGSCALAAPLAAAALRALEAYWFLRLNDFYYFIVVALLLSQVPPGGAWKRPSAARLPGWVRDALRWQTAWIYLATGTLKLNTAWLSGGHLHVRHAYLAEVASWPYPRFLARLLANISVDAGLAWMAVVAELTLGALVAAGRPAALILALAGSIHAYGALGTNVWFFGASMVAQVALLLPRRRGETMKSAGERACRGPAP